MQGFGRMVRVGKRKEGGILGQGKGQKGLWVGIWGAGDRVRLPSAFTGKFQAAQTCTGD